MSGQEVISSGIEDPHFNFPRSINMPLGTDRQALNSNI